mgnify:CR=1 FL=1
MRKKVPERRESTSCCTSTISAEIRGDRSYIVWAVNARPKRERVNASVGPKARTCKELAFEE